MTADPDPNFINFLHFEMTEIALRADRRAQWTNESPEMISAWRRETKKVVIYLMISAQSGPQTGQGFREIVNALNDISDVIEAVVIVDTSFLYRLKNAAYEAFGDPECVTPWQRANAGLFDLLNVERKQIITWPALMGRQGASARTGVEVGDIDVADDGFEAWVTRVRELVDKDEEFVGLVESTLAKGQWSGTRQQNLDFLVEETAMLGHALKGRVQAYCGPLSAPMAYAVEKFGLQVEHLSYDVSRAARKTPCLKV